MLKKLINSKEKQKFITPILQNDSLVLAGVSGMGINTLCNAISQYLQKTHFSIFIYADTPILKSQIEVKDYINNLIKSSSEYKSIEDVFKTKKILFIVNKPNKNKSAKSIIAFINTVKKSSYYKANLIKTYSIGYLNKLRPNTGEKVVIFKGLSKKSYLINCDLYCNFVNQSPLKLKQKRTLYKLTAGHLGLTKSIINLYFQKNIKLNKQILTKDDDIFLRVKEVFIDINKYNPNLKPTHYDYKKFGLVKNKKMGELFSVYLNKYSFNFSDNFSPTEKTIYNLLKKNNNFTSINQIIDHLAKSNSFEITDWTIYKHINNINKKLPKKVNIVNKKGEGYKLKFTK